jgi:hypothetical protein
MPPNTDAIKAALLRTTTRWSTEEALDVLDRLEAERSLWRRRTVHLLTTAPEDWEPEVIRWLEEAGVKK